MVSLYIPDENQDGFKQLELISDESFDRLISLLNEIGPVTPSSKLISKILEKFGEADRDKVHEILQSVTGLDEYRHSADLEAEDLVQRLNDALIAFEIVETEEKAQQVCERLSRLIDTNSSISLTSKISGLKSDYERLFLNSRIITDVRPVFSQDGVEKPEGFLINQTLKIKYRDLEADKEIYLYLDMNDISQLLKQINRALLKTKSLETMFRELEIKFYTDDDQVELTD